jgi:outer membrane usher protein FimD/PapC
MKRCLLAAAIAAIYFPAHAQQGMPYIAEIEGVRGEAWIEKRGNEYYLLPGQGKKFGATVDDEIRLQDVEENIDELRIRARIPLDYLPEQSLSGKSGGGLRLDPTWGGWLNYTLQHNKQRGRSDLLGLFDGVLSTPMGVLNVAFTDKERLFTSFVRNDPEKLTTLVVGDAYSSSYGAATGKKFLGLQWRSGNYALNPNFIYQPTLQIAGRAEADSTYRLYQNGRLIGAGSVKRGEFSLDDFVAPTGTSGNVRMVITDALGNERVIESPLYTMPGMLRAGQTQYAIDAGRIYKEGNKIGDAYFSFSGRRGFESFTAEFGIDKIGDKNSINAGLLYPNRFADVYVRTTSGSEDRLAIGLSREMSINDVSLRAFAENTRRDARSDFSAGVHFWTERWSGLLTTSSVSGDSKKRTTYASISHQFQKGSVFGFVSRSGGKNVVGIGFNVPIGGAQTYGSMSSGNNKAQFGAYGVFGADLRWQAQVSQDQKGLAVRKPFNKAEVDVALSDNKHGVSSRALLRGAIVTDLHSLDFTPPVRSALVIVDTGVPGVPVRGLGKASDASLRSGTPVSVPAHAAFDVRLSLDDLPAGYTAEQESVRVQAPAGVSLVKLDVRQPGFFVRGLYKGTPIPRGVRLVADGEPVVMTDDGAYVQPKAGAKHVRVQAKDCTADVALAEPFSTVEVELCRQDF